MRYLLISTVLLSGCATADAFQPVAPDAAWDTPPANEQAIVKAHFDTKLRDPESARYDFGPMFKAQCNEGWMRGGKVVWYGWAHEVLVNAKNGFGGYSGPQPYTVLYEQGRVKSAMLGRNFGVNDGLCRKLPD